MSGEGWAAVGSIGGAIVGAGLEAQWNRRASEDEYIRQKEFAQNGIRWRVEDARAAGLHPLFALQGNTALYNPSPAVISGGLSSALGEAGQSVGRAVQGQESASEREATALQLKLLESQIGETDARRDYYISEAARNAQTANVSTPLPVDGASPITGRQGDEFTQATQGNIVIKPAEVVSQREGDSTVTAGTSPGEEEFNIGRHGLKIRLPSAGGQGLSEVLENISWYMWPGIIQHNRAIYGPEWGSRFMSEYLSDKRFTPDEPNKFFGRGPGKSFTSGDWRE